MPYNLLSTYDCLSTNDKWNVATSGYADIAPSVITNVVYNLDIKNEVIDMVVDPEEQEDFYF